MTRGEAVAHAARGWTGTRFRPQGRGAEGLDCVGLVAAATGRDAPRDYALRGGSAEGVGAALDAAGLVRVAEAGAGDVLLCAAGPGQWHLVVLTERGFVHADAGLRRVVEAPGRPRWPVVGVWRDLGE